MKDICCVGGEPEGHVAHRAGHQTATRKPPPEPPTSSPPHPWQADGVSVTNHPGKKYDKSHARPSHPHS